jgi:hypothetical protein
METRIQLLAIIGAGGLLIVVLELVRRRSLLERYALLWLFSAVALLVLAAWRGLLQNVAELLGILDAPNALFFLAFAAILILLLHFSVAVSKLADRSKMLAQRLALLEQRLRAVEEDGEVREPVPAPSPRVEAELERIRR